MIYTSEKYITTPATCQLSRVTCHAGLHFFYKIRAYRNNLCMWCWEVQTHSEFSPLKLSPFRSKIAIRVFLLRSLFLLNCACVRLCLTRGLNARHRSAAADISACVRCADAQRFLHSRLRAQRQPLRTITANMPLLLFFLHCLCNVVRTAISCKIFGRVNMVYVELLHLCMKHIFLFCNSLRLSRRKTERG